MANTSGNRRVDGVLGNVALDAVVVVVLGITLQRTELLLHAVSNLPGAQYNLTDAAHCLGVRRGDGQCAHVVQDVLSCDGLAADAGVSECHVLRQVRVEVVAHHDHVKVLIQGVHRVRQGRVGRRRQHVRQASCLDDVRCVAAASTLGVEGVDYAVTDCSQGVVHKAALVQGVGVDCNLNVQLIRNGQCGVDGVSGCTPVLVDLQADCTSADLLTQRVRVRCVALAQEANVDREVTGCLDHAGDVGRTGGHRGCVGGLSRANAATDQGGGAVVQSNLCLLRGNVVNVGIHSTSGHNTTLACNNLGANANDNVNVVLHVRVTGSTDLGNLAILDCNVSNVNAGVVNHGRAGDNNVRNLLVAHRAAVLAHAVTDNLAATEGDLFTVVGQVLLNACHEVGIGQANTIAGSRAVELSVLSTLHLKCHCLMPFLKEIGWTSRASH